MPVHKVSHDTNVWFANEHPSLVERLLAKIFRVRLIPQTCYTCLNQHAQVCSHCMGAGVLLYLRRFYLSPRWKWLPFKIFLHHILLSDTDLARHDHPADFRTTLIKGIYKEEWIDLDATECDRFKVSTKGAGDSTFYPAEHTHRLIIYKPVWSFVIFGKARRHWGFHTANGWKVWHEFLGLTDYKVYPEDEIG